LVILPADRVNCRLTTAECFSLLEEAVRWANDSLDYSLAQLTIDDQGRLLVR
jgi:hypothetical protein